MLQVALCLPFVYFVDGIHIDIAHICFVLGILFVTHALFLADKDKPLIENPSNSFSPSPFKH